MTELRCFVAMALRHTDTDKVYDTMIVPVLRRLHVHPTRIDRIEFIEDVDDRIIAELRRCDFVLADLTYARPSVYFEAGFGQRAVPVIYTCRRDHFHPSRNDTLGNLRIHFDLQMKNILPWSSATDSTFKQRLARRLSKALRPLIRASKDEEERREAILAFKALSPVDQINQIRKIAGSELRKAGFEVKQPKQPWYAWVGIKLEGDCIHLAAVRVDQRILKRELAEVVGWSSISWIIEVRKSLDGARIRNLRRASERLILCALEKVPHSRASAALPSFAVDSNLEAYVSQQPLQLELGVDVRADVQVHLIDGIASSHAFEAELRRRLTPVNMRQGHATNAPNQDRIRPPKIAPK